MRPWESAPAPLRPSHSGGDAAGQNLGDLGAADLGGAVEVGDARDPQHAVVAARSGACARSRAAAGRGRRRRVRRSCRAARRRAASSIGFGGAPDDFVDPNQPLVTLHIEEYAIVADLLTKLGRMVSQWQDISLGRVERKLIQRSIDSTAIIQRKLSQIFLCAVREDQLPGHA
jgi:hypothetical protein